MQKKMAMIKKIKRVFYLSIASKFFDQRVLKVMETINQVLFHWNEREKMTHPGSEDQNKVYYVIRPSSKEEGLLSLFFHNAIEGIFEAQERGFIPYIDYSSSLCQYYEDRTINGTNNAWEYYFQQPCDLELKDILKKKNVLYSGWSVLPDRKEKIGELTVSKVTTEPIKSVCLQTCAVKPYIWNIVENKCNNLMVRGKTLGVFIRGTDYVALKPKGHYKQPTPAEVMGKVDEFLQKYSIAKIFVVTEDRNIYEQFQKKYGERVFSSDEDFVTNYSSTDYIEGAFHNDPYERGLNYLVRLLLLTKCDYLVSSITNGSLFALAEKDYPYKDKYIFDIGKY